jgi:hypothetical protein
VADARWRAPQVVEDEHRVVGHHVAESRLSGYVISGEHRPLAWRTAGVVAAQDLIDTAPI